MRNLFTIFCIVFLYSCSEYTTGQEINKSSNKDTIKVLFIGNSYTYVNDLPSLLKKIGSSNGKTIITDQDTPGGSSLEYHWNSGVPQKLIKKGGWNYLILQEYSQRPSATIAEFNNSVVPYFVKFDNLFKQYNRGKTILYMTWGRKDGDSDRCGKCPNVCTYEGMDSLTKARYIIIGDTIKSYISPVGAVWRYIRNNYQDIELYQNDKSHPSLNGSIAGALCFYSIITQKSPFDFSYSNPSISTTNIQKIKDAVEKVAYDSLYYWNIGPSCFSYQLKKNNTVTYKNLVRKYDSILWQFGDGEESTEKNPTHQFPHEGIYRTILYITKQKETHSFSLDVSTNSLRKR